MPLMLEVAIGLVFIYLVLSLLCSAISEALEQYLRYRADYLRQGIEKLLLSGDATLRDRLYAHPLIKSLYTRSKLEGRGRAAGPSYIPSRQFVLALMDIVTGETASRGTTSTVASVEQFRAALDENKSLPAPLAQALRTLIADAGNDLEKVKANIQEWFDGSMDRVSGWYKRRAQFVLLVIGAAVAVIINVDTLAIINTLSNDSAIRAAVVSAAEASAPPATEEQLTETVRARVAAVSKQLGALGLPVGWRRLASDSGGVDEGFLRRTPEEQRRYRIENRILPTTFTELGAQLVPHWLGWLLTAFAISFGAPFWFDTLNKIMVIRATVKPREKSGEEGSEDRPVRGETQTVKIEVAAVKS